MANKARIAIVGCGAAARLFHLPALAESPLELMALIDAAPQRARDLADLATARLGGDAIRYVGGNLSRAFPLIDAAIVATHNAAHADVTCQLLRAGKHVLLEKPLALNTEQCAQITEAAQEGGIQVVPAHVRRFFPMTPWIRSVLSNGRLGRLRRINWQEGQPYDWPTTTEAMFWPRAVGGGLLFDAAPHIFDTLLYWLGEDGEAEQMADNALGGTDSEFYASLRYGEVPVEITLSRLRALASECVLTGENATLRVATEFPGVYRMTDNRGSVLEEGPVPILGSAQAEWEDLFKAQLIAFADVIADKPTDVASLSDGVRVVQQVERCIASARPTLARPWEGEARIATTRHIAVTGATGFIGSHVADRALAGGGTVTAVYRRVSRLARLSHHDVGRLHFKHADALDRDALAAAFAGCDSVIHTTYGKEGDLAAQWEISVAGTAAVLEAAKLAGVRRVIVVSSVAVYDVGDREQIDEQCPVLPDDESNLTYGYQKLAAQRLALEAAGSNLEVVCAQPTVVYGPFAPSWTLDPLMRLRSGNVRLPSGPEGGTCNPVHVHDVADALLHLCTASGVNGQAILINGLQPVSWGQFYDAYRAMLGKAQERTTGSQLELDEWEMELYRSGAVFSCHALKKSGFAPCVSFDEGITHTSRWAQWAGLL